MDACNFRKWTLPYDSTMPLPKVKPEDRLPSAEINACAIKAKAGCKQSADRLVRAMLYDIRPISIRMAQKYRRDAEDLYQEGVLGIYKAINVYNPKWGFRAHGIRWALALMRRLAKHDHDWSDGQSLDAPNHSTRAAQSSSESENGDEITQLNTLASEDPSPEEIVESDRQSVRINMALVRARRLDGLPRDIIENRLKRYDDPKLTLEEIGDRWNVSRERVRQVEVKTKKMLQMYLAPFQRGEAA